jgi:hypothetical protein
MIVESKKKWRRPELIVLVRGRPEEMVLLACKTVSGPGESYRDGTGYYCTRDDDNNCGTYCSDSVGT